AVRNLSLEIANGETLVLLGSSGCGKSTTLKMILRLFDPSQGQILVEGQPLIERDRIEWRRSVGYVFQGIGLFPHMSVFQNVEIGMRLKGNDKLTRRKRSQELLEMVGLDPGKYGQRLPAELSGGQ